MQGERREHRQAAENREAARARVRRVTGIVLGTSVALAGTLAGYVSSAGSKGKTTATQRAAAAATTKAAAQVPVPAAPDPPSLLPFGSSSSGSSAAQAPVQAPGQAQAPPVAVSGGS
jgi:hypothetical protein